MACGDGEIHIIESIVAIRYSGFTKCIGSRVEAPYVKHTRFICDHLCHEALRCCLIRHNIICAVLVQFHFRPVFKQCKPCSGERIAVYAFSLLDVTHFIGEHPDAVFLSFAGILPITCIGVV